MSIFDDAPAGATGVATEVAGSTSADPVSPNEEPSAAATETPDPTSIVPEGQPKVAEVEGAPPATAAVAPPWLTEEDLTKLQAQLPPDAGQAFAKFRTENRSLTAEVERLKTENEGLQTPPGGA